MRGRLLPAVLAMLADFEIRLFGLGVFDHRGESWITRQRQISRVYFAIGFTWSILAGAIALLVVMTIDRGRATPGATAVTSMVPPAQTQSPSRNAVGLGPKL